MERQDLQRSEILYIGSTTTSIQKLVAPTRDSPLLRVFSGLGLYKVLTEVDNLNEDNDSISRSCTLCLLKGFIMLTFTIVAIVVFIVIRQLPNITPYRIDGIKLIEELTHAR